MLHPCGGITRKFTLKSRQQPVKSAKILLHNFHQMTSYIMSYLSRNQLLIFCFTSSSDIERTQAGPGHPDRVFPLLGSRGPRHHGDGAAPGLPQLLPEDTARLVGDGRPLASSLETLHRCYGKKTTVLLTRDTSSELNCFPVN